MITTGEKVPFGFSLCILKRLLIRRTYENNQHFYDLIHFWDIRCLY